LLDSVLNALPFVERRVIDANFDIDFPSTPIDLSSIILTAHCPIPEQIDWIDG